MVKNMKMDRRSVTIRPEVDTQVRDMISAATRYRTSLDYTKAINLLAELGGDWLQNSSPDERRKFREVISKYLDYDAFEESILDEWAELGEFRRWKEAKARRDAAKVKNVEVAAAGKG